MKKLYLLIFALAFLPLYSFSQDYWEHITTNDTSGIYSLAVAKDGTIYYGGKKGLFISHDDGLTWYYRFLFDYIGVASLEFDLDSNLIVGASYKLYKYNIEQDSFYYLNAPEDANYITVFIDSNQIFTNSNLDYVLRFSNGQWDKILIKNETGSVTDIIKDSSGVIFVSTMGIDFGGGIFRSFNNGDTWEYFGLHHYYARSLGIDSYNRLYAGAVGHVTTSEGGFFRYNYELQQWDTINHNARVQSLYFNEEDSLYAGIYSISGNGGAWMSPDYGDTWIKIISGLTINDFNVSDITEGPTGYLYAIVGEKAIYKSTDSTITVINKTSKKNFDQIIVYPNPFKDSFLVESCVKLENDHLTIHLFDILSREQKIIVDELENGCFRIQMEEFSASGVYFLKVQSGIKVYTRKVFKY